MITFGHVRQALALADFDAHSAHHRMLPLSRRVLPEHAGTPPRQAGVLILIYPEVGGGLHIVLTRRADSLRGHSGQVAFPGGRRDPHDASFIATALREACEELDLCDFARIHIVGQLTQIYIPPSHHAVHPIVGVMYSPPTLRPNPAEVADVFSLSITDLLSARLKRSETRTFQGKRFPVPYYDVNGYKVWGATAIMLSEFEQRLRVVLPQHLLNNLDIP